ncbi:MAG: CoA transferase [Rhodobiaceae bacterium]|nr:CoA transferase [Rhodobiaceae bacterium]
MESVPKIKVLDMSTHFSGSVASAHLVALGADVVKLESPKFGDGNRGLEPFIEGEAMVHVALNSGKRSVALDRRSPDWDATLRACVQWADVVIVGSQPVTAAKRGLDFETLVGMNDQLVYCNISGYGQVGPWKDNPLHGLNGDVLAGLVPVSKVDGYFAPAVEYRSVGTTLAGIHAALGILEAIRRRDAGQGAQQVYGSVWESAMYWQWRDMTAMSNLGVPNPAYADLGSRYASYETSDGRIILICPIEERFWISFCELLNLPENWKSRGSWAKTGMDWGKGYDDEKPVIAKIMAEKPFAFWNKTFDEAGIPYSPYYTVEEAMNTPQGKAIGVTAETEVRGKQVRVPNIPIHIAARDAGNEPLHGPETVQSPPALGEHNEEFIELLKEKGLVKQ